MSPAEKKMRSLLGELKELGAHQTETLFACGGSIELDQPIRLHYSSREGSELQEGTAVFPPRDVEKSLSALVEACDPAGFGRGHELVMDKEYRSASEMSADRMLTSFSLPETAIMSEIQSLLAPNASVVRARLYKLNVYETGGLFKAHVDTPRSSNMFGTLVVCLPTSFTGGDFVVEHKGQKQTFAWSHANPPSEAKDGAQQAPPATLQWCAFYSDCQHEVLQVTSGYRVTLTYLLESDESVAGTGALDGIKSNPFVVKLDELIKESKLDREGRVLGFALEHKYVVDGTGTVPMLKGFDQFVQAALDALKLKYRFAPVFLASRGGEKGFRKRSYEPLPDRILDRPSVSSDDTEAYVGNWRTLVAGASDCFYREESEESGETFEEVVLDASEEEVQWIVPPTSMQYMLHSVQYGNEPLGYEYYATAAFLVSV